MLHYFTIKSLKSEVVGDYGDIFTLLPHVQIALIKKYILFWVCMARFGGGGLQGWLL